MKGVLKAVGVLVILMATGSVRAEDQNVMASSGVIISTQIVPPQIPGGGPIGTTNWLDGPAKPPTPCVLC